MGKDILYNYVFHFNPFLGNWGATTREFKDELFSGDRGNVIRSSEIATLVDLITRTGGDKEKIKALTETIFTQDPLI